jgi:hypothetical protein
MISPRRRTRSRYYTAIIAAAVVAIAVLTWLDRDAGGRRGVEGSGATAVDPGEAAVLEAYRRRSSDLWLEAAGVVERLLADDLEGDRHQRFILALPSGHTLLMSHNIDVAPRVPVAVGDTLEFRGEYEWNEQGGVIHWTHRDRRGRRPGGWIRHRGEVYR